MGLSMLGVVESADGAAQGCSCCSCLLAMPACPPAACLPAHQCGPPTHRYLGRCPQIRPADEGEDDGDMGADSAEAARRHAGGGGGPDGLPLSPRSMPLGAKIKPLADEDSQLSDAMLTAPASTMVGQQSPAILSPFRPAPHCPPVEGGSLGAGAGDDSDCGVAHGLLPPPPPLPLGDSGVGVPGGMPHSTSLAGGMDVLMAPLGSGLEGLPGGVLARPDSMASLMMAGEQLRAVPGLGSGAGGLGPPDSRNTSAILGGG